jgi:putative membrane protein
MNFIPLIFILFVAGLHVYFLILEMFLWTKPKGLKIFKNSFEKAQLTKVLAANQGLYNGFLAAGLIWPTVHPKIEFGKQLGFFFLSCVVIAAIYGAYSVNKKYFSFKVFQQL